MSPRSVQCTKLVCLVDYEQIELRILAHLSGDPILIKEQNSHSKRTSNSYFLILVLTLVSEQLNFDAFNTLNYLYFRLTLYNQSFKN